MKQTRILVFMGLLISMEIILTRFLSIQTPIIRIGFGFVPIAFSAIMFGPFIGGITAMLSDIMGMMVAPKGPYFFGFTLSALLMGAIYGFFLYNKPKTIVRVFVATLAITLFVDMGLNTLWLSMITGKAAAVLVPPRLIKSAIMLPIQTIMVYVLWRYVGVFAISSFQRKIPRT